MTQLSTTTNFVDNAVDSKQGFAVNGTTVIDSSGNYVGPVLPTDLALANGKVFVGNASNVAAAVTLSQDVTITNTGVATVASATGPFKVTSAAATALTVGPNGTTTPSLTVDASTASAVTGLNIKSAAVGAGLALSVLSTVGGTNENLTLDAKGSGTVTINGTATGAVILPASTTIGGSSVLALGTVTSSATTGAEVSITNTGIYTGTGVLTLTANSLTTGAAALFTANGVTTGQVLSLASTSTGLTSGSLLSVSTATTGAVATNGVVSLVATGNYTSTSNVGLLTLVANSTTAGTVASIFANAATTGVALLASGTGVYTGTGFVTITQSGATTGTLAAITGSGVTTGILLSSTAAVATLTTGRYFSANDGATEVFGIGANGHIHSKQSASAPSIAITVNQGISAVALATGATDTCGTITTTGTQNNTADSTFTLTFGKTYTTAPKAVILSAANASAGIAGAGEAYVSSISATAVVIGIGKSAVSGATPSYSYVVIA